MGTSKTLKLKQPLSPLQQARFSQVLNPHLWKATLKKEKPEKRDIKPPENKGSETKKPKERKEEKAKEVKAKKEIKKPTEKRDKAETAVKPKNDNDFSEKLLRTKAKKKQIKEAVSWLCEAYPQCFSQKAPRPLCIGVFEDILLEGKWPYSKTLLRRVLGVYTRSALYQKAILEEGVRYSLTGDIAQQVVEFEKHHALEGLKALEERKKERKRKNTQTHPDPTP